MEATSAVKITNINQASDFVSLVRRYVARVCFKAAAFATQPSLLAADCAVGVSIVVTYRTPWYLSYFFESEQANHAASESLKRSCVGPDVNVVKSFATIMFVSETCLVHYTKKAPPKPRLPADKVEGVCCVLGGNPSSGESRQACNRSNIDEKYWKRRYNYFSRFDEGIRMDPAGWFEVTPESVAKHIADRMRYDVIVDATAGVGGNTIQFALNSRRVIAVDMDAGRLRDAAHNAGIYGVRDRIEFVCDDFLHFAKTYSGTPIDAVFVSPPWGGPEHLDQDYFSLKDVDCPDIVSLFAAAVHISRRVTLFLPRHVNLHEIALLASRYGFGVVEVEKILFRYPEPHLKLVNVYFAPEVEVPALLRASTTNKSVGPVVVPTPDGNGCANKFDWSGGDLLDSLCLAGPVVRALYCRHHYVGKYIVALALSCERRALAHLPEHRKVPARRTAPSTQLGDSSKGRMNGRKHRHQLALAFRAVLGGGSESVDFDWLLGAVSLLDLLRLAGDVCCEQLERTSGVAGENGRRDVAKRFLALLLERFPKVYASMLSHRKVAAMVVVTNADA